MRITLSINFGFFRRSHSRSTSRTYKRRRTPNTPITNGKTRDYDRRVVEHRRTDVYRKQSSRRDQRYVTLWTN